MPRYALTVHYIGKGYAGSQIQFDKNGLEIAEPTIQGELEKAISTLINCKRCEADVGSRERDEQGGTLRDRRCDRSESEGSGQIFDLTGGNTHKKRQIKTIFSGRTDRGVNSKGQVVHFDTDKIIVASKFVYSLNEILPDDISVCDFREVEKSFHAQKSAKRRIYEYEFINRRCKDAFDGDLMRIKFPISIERMQKSLDYLKGEHDFSSFKSSGTLNPSKICVIYSAEILKKDNDRVVVRLEGNRFLYNMVRAIVGTLLEIEGHNLPAEHMKDVLEAKDRRKAGQNVSPYGLTLMRVEYPQEALS